MPYESKGFKDDMRRLKRAVIAIVSDVWFLNRVSQCCFVVGLSGIGGVGVIFAIPYLYTDYSENVVFYVRAFGCFLALQMIVNWLCIKFVGTSYNPFRDGVIPDGISMGENISRVRYADENQNNGLTNSRGRKDATTVNLGTGSTGSLMYVASELPKSAEEGPKRTAYPYFSWTPCLRCNRPRPPRCHHCPMCNTCVLKRDHHCFIAGACVGYRNLRHFTVFLFWASVATTFATLHALPYYYYDVLPYTSYFDFIFPIAITRAMFGYIDVKFALFIVLGWILLGFLFWSISFLQVVVNLIKAGKTTFEKEYKMELTDTRGFLGKIRAVYGNYWILNFIVPLHNVFEPIDDPVRWPYIKA
ncbi:uncharacterized protein LOC123537627 [Mercenaria mercenaria]|uniref:uncharacterized protein LOC123537627 n=1 Tax=Mercenaria mercenaria TaxID=6596 RepID=UPI00234FA639|nr:uncharacterized protein LOC123537627 [Mercenaria mercenaria]